MRIAALRNLAHDRADDLGRQAHLLQLAPQCGMSRLLPLQTLPTQAAHLHLDQLAQAGQLGAHLCQLLLLLLGAHS